MTVTSAIVKAFNPYLKCLLNYYQNLQIDEGECLLEFDLSCSLVPGSLDLLVFGLDLLGR